MRRLTHHGPSLGLCESGERDGWGTGRVTLRVPQRERGEAVTDSESKGGSVTFMERTETEVVLVGKVDGRWVVVAGIAQDDQGEADAWDAALTIMGKGLYTDADLLIDVMCATVRRVEVREMTDV